MSKIRVRFAPSPTGMLHIGAARTALYSWLFAKQQKGSFILRIEDTDKAREVESAIDNIEQSLLWLGLEWNETYKQSTRLDIYQQYAHQLLRQGMAYADPYSVGEVDKFRKDAAANKQPFLYRNYRPDNPPEWQPSLPLRFKVKDIKTYQWQDDVRGQLSAGAEALDDIILMKSDGYPTYNFAHIVDDHLMEISHVLRGDEFLASMPKYLALYEALGWTPPAFVTLPPILGKDGAKKLSKREGASAVLEYRDKGYLPQALNNFLALLGWNDGTEQELFSTVELIEKFTLSRIQKSPAKFDAQRLVWMNTQHLHGLEIADLLKAAEDFWPQLANKASASLKEKVLTIERERIKTLGDLKDLPEYFFKPPELSPKAATALQDEFASNVDDLTLTDWLNEVKKLITEVGSTDHVKLETELRERIKNHRGRIATLFSVLRVILTDADSTPPIWEIVYVLGKNESINRLETVQKLLAN